MQLTFVTQVQNKLLKYFLLSLFISAALFYSHFVFTLRLLVLGLSACDALFSQVFVAANVCVGKPSVLLNQDGNTH